MNSTRRELILVVPFFAALFLLMAWPLARNFTTLVPTSGDGADALTGLYILNWGIHALANQPFGYFNANNFYPHVETLAFGEHLFGVAVMMAPFQWTLAHPILTYNLTLVLSFTLAGTGAYFLARQVTGSVRAGLIAGILYGFSPFRIDHIGDLGTLALHGLPWILLIGHLYLEDRRRRLIYLGAFFALVQVLSSTVSLYYLVVGSFLALIMAVYRQRRASSSVLWSHRLHFLTVTALLLFFLFPFLKPYLSQEVELFALNQETTAGMVPIPHESAAVSQAGIVHSLFRTTRQPGTPLFPGFTAMALIGFLALRMFRGRFDDDHRPYFYTGLALAALLLAILFHLRFGGLMSLCLAVLAALGMRRLEITLSSIPRGTWMASVLIVGVAFEMALAPVHFISPAPFPGPPPVYDWFNNTDPASVVLELPAAPTEGPMPLTFARRQYYSTYHWRRMVDGVDAWTHPLTIATRARLRSFPDNAAIAQIRALGVDYVVVHLDEYPEADRDRVRMELDGRTELTLEKEFEDTRVYRVVSVHPQPGL